MMKLVPVASLILLLAWPVSGQTPKTKPAAEQEQCHITGMVVKLAGSEPLRLIPSAVIAGRILDEDGEPLPEPASPHCEKSIPKENEAFLLQTQRRPMIWANTGFMGWHPADIL
jgi:hypothetical protein